MQLSMPGPRRGRWESLRVLGASCSFSPLFYALMSYLGDGALWVLMLGVPLLCLGPWLYYEWRLSKKDKRVFIDIRPNSIRYTHLSTTYVIPIRAIRMVDAPEDQSPRVALKLNWSGARIQCPPALRGLTITWLLETRQQARWLTAQLRRLSIWGCSQLTPRFFRGYSNAQLRIVGRGPTQ